MAGDWIKMRTNLHRNPRVLRIASAFNADVCPQSVPLRLAVVGALHAIWSLADEQTEDGRLDAYSFAAINEMIGWPGFCEAVASVGWMSEDAEGVEFPRFSEHNGASAKRRAQEADRKRVARASVETSANASASNADKKRTREEKRREEINKGEPVYSGSFLKFWGAWPKSERKVSKGLCWDVWRRKDFEQDAAAILEHVEALKASTSWRESGGKFIPAPLVYLNQKRWEGAAEASEPVKQAWHP